MAIDPAASGAVLKRERVRDALLELIEARRPGDAVPSERTLCAQLGVSRPTVRAAVDELVVAGLLVREHGRGMFVAAEKITQELVAGSGALTVPQARGVWTSRVLELRTLPAGARVGRRLRVSPAATIRYAARLRLVDGAPMAIEHLHLPAALVPGLTGAELEQGDLYEHFRDRHGVRVAEAVQSVEPTVVTRAEADLLDVPELSPALLFERLTTDTAGRPVEVRPLRLPGGPLPHRVPARAGPVGPGCGRDARGRDTRGRGASPPGLPARRPDLPRPGALLGARRRAARLSRCPGAPAGTPRRHAE
ncbi:transcriptional regulator [Streptomyces gancidicus BKS 13-15]|uniref:Transcriptional regulator n=1 Tax=Streptomyces gancidicus BKS 13-15 TaxID=1284664 RepID=M3C3Q3_STREZ|nr:transcriptional regulator [Streptomyces gancidicus BKS 13-15]